MTAHVFVDETKQRGYVMVAGVVVPTDLDAGRKLIRALILPGQRRIHMNSESDSRRRLIADALARSGATAIIYNAGRRYNTDRERRAHCLDALVRDAAAQRHTMLVLEQDDTLLSWDKRCLLEATRAAGCQDTLRYEHRRAVAEELLAIPDAIAWCWAKGGHWRTRIAGMITDVRDL